MPPLNEVQNDNLLTLKHISFCYGKCGFEFIFTNIRQYSRHRLILKNGKELYTPRAYLILKVVFKNLVMNP